MPKVMYLSVSVANQIALQWHPDKVEASMRSEAEEKFKDIKEAYEILTDGTISCNEYLVDRIATKRQLYDQYGMPLRGEYSDNRSDLVRSHF